MRIDQGWLTLIGDLNWLYEKHAAEADVRLLPGVSGVTNAIAIKRGVRGFGIARSRNGQACPANARRHLRSGKDCKQFAMARAGRPGHFWRLE